MSHFVEAVAYCLAILYREVYRGRQIAENSTPLILLEIAPSASNLQIELRAQDINAHPARQRQVDCGRSVPRCWPGDQISLRGQPRFSSRGHGTRCGWHVDPSLARLLQREHIRPAHHPQNADWGLTLKSPWPKRDARRRRSWKLSSAAATPWASARLRRSPPPTRRRPLPTC